MGFKYLVSGSDSLIELDKKISELIEEGHIPVVVKDGTTLRGRVNGEIIYLGDYESLWNWQEIWESIVTFRELNPEEEIPDVDRPEDFFEYGVGD